ncbi:MAG: outer membrane beta-barrel protein [Opitutaceae bacterium]
MSSALSSSRSSAPTASANRNRSPFARLLLVGTSAGLAATVFAEKPKALSELSVTVKETFDSNVFGTERNPTLAGLPALAEVDSWVTTVSPKVVFNAREALGLASDSALTAFNLGYAGDYAFYHSASTETNQRHNFTQQLKGKSGDVSFAFDNSFIYVDGKSATNQYGLTSAYGTGTTRERKEQIQERAKAVLRFDNESPYFFRAVATVLYYDLQTQLRQPTGSYTGWQNYVDRQDLNIGADIGYKATKDLSLYAGYRYGEQQQDALPWSPVHNDSTYHRFLVGLEGKVAPWLKVDFQAGPDYRDYTDVANLGRIGDSETFVYTDGSITADFSKADSLTFSNKIWHWVSSTGVTAYRDSAYVLTYKHKFSGQLSGTLGFRALGSDYDLPATRKDWIYTYSAGLRYDINKQYAVTADYAYTSGDNKRSNVTYPGREFHQNLLSFGLRAAF